MIGDNTYVDIDKSTHTFSCEEVRDAAVPKLLRAENIV